MRSRCNLQKRHAVWDFPNPIRAGTNTRCVTMSLELDHVFVNTAPGAPEADQLLSFGLVEGSSNVHPGQGTANRRFFCHAVNRYAFQL